MENYYNEMKNLASKLNTEFEAYEKRPTKASSKRLRALTNEISRNGVAFRKVMINTDKGE